MGKKKEKAKEHIVLDKETQEELKEVVRTSNDLQTRLNIMILYYVRGAKKKGEYQISRDFTKLEKVEKPDG